MILQRLCRAAVAGVVSVTLGPAMLLLAGEAVGRPKLPTHLQKPVSSPAVVGFRARTNSALSAPFPATPQERKTQAKKLISLYKEIGDAQEVVAAERSRLHTRLKARLVRLADAIAFDTKQELSASRSQSGNRSSIVNQPPANRSSTGDASMAADRSTSQAAATGSNGGGSQNDGQALVELIQATIAPQSWQVNGGPGSIVYWPAWQVLVVRQTDDVHEQIGGVMHGMRK